MTGTARTADVATEPKMTAQQVRRLLESMGKHRSLLQTIASAPCPGPGRVALRPRGVWAPGRVSLPAAR